MSATPATLSHQRWTAADVAPGSWIVELTPAGAQQVVDFARANESLDIDGPEALVLAARLPELLPEAAQAMAQVGVRVREGDGFAVLDRLAVDALDVVQSKVAAWALFSCIGRVVNQKVDGVKVYDVRDTQPKFGHGVRRSITNQGQEFHTDGGWLDRPPEFIGLFCREPAEEGGLNQVLSLVTAHDRLAAAQPEALERLRHTFFWDRQSEHPPAEAKVRPQPVFYDEDGHLNVRYYDDYIRTGHKLTEQSIDEPGTVALEALREIVQSPDLQLEFGLERGQFLFVNNRRVAHSRSAFRAPGGEGVSRRHYFRLWSRVAGEISLDG